MTNFKTTKYILSLIAMVWTLAVSADTPAAELQQVPTVSVELRA